MGQLTKIKVTTIASNGDQWIKLATVAHGDVFIDKLKNPKIAEAIIGGAIEVEVDLFQKGNAWMAADPEQKKNSGSGKGYGQPKDEGVITMLSCISSAVALHARTPNVDITSVTEDAEIFFQLAISKSTLKK